MDVPADLRYSKEHEWVRLEDGSVTIGITDYAQDQLGDIVYLDLPAAGAMLTQFDKLGEIESVKAVSELYSPIGGEVVEANQAAADEPEIVNAEPYGGGWLVKVRIDDATQIDQLLSAGAYGDLISREMEENAG